MSKNSFRVYCLGGCGLNISTQLSLPNDITYLPNSYIGRVDTSESNVITNNDSLLFLIPGVDGSGKKQSFTYAVAVPYIDAILLEQPPKDFNVVVFSLGGGTGSVLGPLIIKELLTRKIPVVGIVVESTGSLIESENCLRALASLQSVSQSVVKKPIAISIHKNGKSIPEQQINSIITDEIKALAMLTSGANKGLDTKDIENWLNFPLTTKVSPQLVELVIGFAGKDTPYVVQNDLKAISVASLLTTREDGEVDKELDTLALYQTVGHSPKITQDSTSVSVSSIHCILTTSYLANRINNLKQTVILYEEEQKAIIEEKTMEFGLDINTDGFCF